MRERESTTFSYIKKEEAIIVTLDDGLLPLILALLFYQKKKKKWHGIFGAIRHAMIKEQTIHISGRQNQVIEVISVHRGVWSSHWETEEERQPSERAKSSAAIVRNDTAFIGE